MAKKHYARKFSLSPEMEKLEKEKRKFQPITWTIGMPDLVYDNRYLEIMLYYTVHDGGGPKGKGRKGMKSFVYHRDDFFPELVKIAQALSFDSVAIVHEHNVKVVALEKILIDRTYDKFCETSDYAKVEEFFLISCERLLTELIKEYTLREFARKQIRFHEPEIQEIFHLALEQAEKTA